MRFQILAPAAFLAGLASAMPTNSSATIFPHTGFVGKTVAWPIDGACHNIAEQAPKLETVGSMKVKGDIACHLYDETDCNGNYIDIGGPGAADLLMIMKWALRAQAIMCEQTPSKTDK